MKILLLPLSLILSIIVICLRPFVIIRFGMIPHHRIGHFVQDVSLYLLEKKDNKKKTNSPLDFFSYGDDNLTSNKFLKKKFDKKLLIGNQHIIFPIIKIIKIICKYFSIKNFHEIVLSDFDEKNLINKNKNQLINFDNNEQKEGEEILNNMGIEKNQKFVLLMIRDKNYLSFNFPNQDWSYHNYRNFDLKLFIGAINMFIDNGFTVIRMGTETSDKFPLKREKFIDYAKSEYRSDFMDFYLIANCYFCVSTIYGLDSVARIFKKPMLGLQCPVVTRDIFNFYDLITLPILFDEINKKKICTKDILDIPFFNNSDLGSSGFNSRNLKKLNLSLIPNSSEEIKDACKDMLEIQSSNAKNLKYDNQNEFWQMVQLFINKKKSVKNFDFANKRTMISKSFFTKYKDLIV